MDMAYLFCNFYFEHFTLNPAHPQMVQIVIEQTAVITTTVTINSIGFSGFFRFSVFDSVEFISLFFLTKNYVNYTIISRVYLSFKLSCVAFNSYLPWFWFTTIYKNCTFSPSPGDFLKLHTKNHKLRTPKQCFFHISQIF